MSLTCRCPRRQTGEVVVEVKAAAINPGEAAIRSGALADRFPATFPSGEGSDLAGIVSAVGEGVDEFAVGDPVLGFSFRRSSHATHVSVPTSQLIQKPPELSWEVAGSLYVVGCTAYAAVRAVDAKEGETVAVCGGGGRGRDRRGPAAGACVVRVSSVSPRRRTPTGSALMAPSPSPTATGSPSVCERRPAGRSMRSSTSSGPSTSNSRSISGSLVTVSRRSHRSRKPRSSASRPRAAGPPPLLKSSPRWPTSSLRERSRFRSRRPIPLDRVADAFEELEQRHTRGKIVLIP